MCGHEEVGIEAKSAVLGWSTLKEQYLDCLRAVSANRITLRSVISELLSRGAGWNHMVRWAVEAGYDQNWARKIISEVLREGGIRRRRSGGGRETPQEALTLLAFARREYGERAGNLLRAAARAAKKEEVMKGSCAPRLEVVGG